MRRTLRTAAALAGGAALSALVVAVGLRLLERRASSWFLPDGAGPGPSDPPLSAHPRAVLVLGYADTGTRPGPRNLARVRAALAVLEPDDVLVASGGGVAGPVTEARLLADGARALGWTGALRIEERSRSTWENIALSAPLLEDAARIVVVSEPVHAAKARRFLRLQRPGLAARLVPARTADGADPLPSAGLPGTVLALVDLWLSEHADGWAQDSAQGLAGGRRLLATRA